MNRKEITSSLNELLIWNRFYEAAYRKYWASEVTLDYYSTKRVRVDFLEFRPTSQTPGGIERGAFHFYEVKSSVEDFFSEADHTFEGDFGWYVMPFSVWNDPLVQQELNKGYSKHTGCRHTDKLGVLCAPEDFTSLHTVRNAKRLSRERGANELLFMMLRSTGRDRSKLAGFDADGNHLWLKRCCNKRERNNESFQQFPPEEL